MFKDSVISLTPNNLNKRRRMLTIALGALDKMIKIEI